MSQMEPEEWERLADETARALTGEVDGIETAPSAGPAGYRTFWVNVRDLNERIRTAPAIKLEDKLALQHRVNVLCQQARQDQKATHERVRAEEVGLLDALALAAETLTDAEGVPEVQAVRADLAFLRKRVEQLAPELRREQRQRMWNTWQRVNQDAWSMLQVSWERNEHHLEALLDEAEQCLQAGDPRGARERVKAFHAAVTVHECAHQASRRQRVRANRLWEQAATLSAQKHAAYLAGLGRRVSGWRVELEHKERAMETIRCEIEALEVQTTSATTGVAAAMVRGQLEERKKALTRLAAERDALTGQIAAGEKSLDPG